MAEETKNPAAEAENQAPAEQAAAPEAAKEEVTVEEAKAEELQTGMVVRVHQKIKEMTPKGEERERIQMFEGTVIAIKGKDDRSRTITVRKIASGVGVERIFPMQSTAIAKFEVVKQYETSRAKLYYLRTHKKKLKEKAKKAA